MLNSTLKPRDPTAKEEAKSECENFLTYIRDYTRTGKRAAKLLIAELHKAYCEANFGIDGPYNTHLGEADVCKAVAEYVEREHGLPITTHKQLDESCR